MDKVSNMTPLAMIWKKLYKLAADYLSFPLQSADYRREC